MDLRSLRTVIRELAEPIITHMGLDLVAVEILPGARRQILRLSIDTPQGGVGADDCAAVSHQLSPMLDAEDPMPCAYNLEVSSPGAARPVQRRDDFRRFAGFQVKIRLEPGPSRRRYAGEILGIQGDLLQLKVDDEVFAVDLHDIEDARLVLDAEAYASLAQGLPAIPPESQDPLDDTTLAEAHSAAKEAK